MASDDATLSAWVLIGGSVGVGLWFWRLRHPAGAAPSASGSDSGGGGTIDSSGQPEPGVDFQRLIQFASEWGLTVTSPKNGDPANGTGGHNPGSAHYTWQAIDVSVAGLSEATVTALKAAAAAVGIVVIDERRGPAQAGGVWTGPHLHLQSTIGGQLGGTS